MRSGWTFSCAMGLVASGIGNCLATPVSIAPTQENPGEVSTSIETRVVARGSVLHGLFGKSLKADQRAETMAVDVRYPAEWSRQRDSVSPLDSLARIGANRQFKSTIIDDLPPPDDPAPIGTRHQSVGHCQTVMHNRDAMLASVTYTYEYRNRDDTNGDGKADANPGWVLVSTSINYYNEAEQTPCL